jgi:diaminopimelate epimerase
MFPGGNDTYITFSEDITRSQYSEFNRSIMSRYPHLEQGGFFERSETGKAAIRLQMAGGEFCGNATRAAAALLVKGMSIKATFLSLVNSDLVERQGGVTSFPMEVSGTEQILKVSCTEVSPCEWTVETEIPVPRSDSLRDWIVLPDATDTVPVIHLDGISHILLDESLVPFDKDNYESTVRVLLKHAGLDTKSAAGVIWYSQVGEAYTMNPVVYVRDINTCFYETSCGSGAAALAIQESMKTDAPNSSVYIVPPSGHSLQVRVHQEEGNRLHVWLKGMVEFRGIIVEQKSHQAPLHQPSGFPNQDSALSGETAPPL